MLGDPTEHKGGKGLKFQRKSHYLHIILLEATKAEVFFHQMINLNMPYLQQVYLMFFLFHILTCVFSCLLCKVVSHAQFIAQKCDICHLFEVLSAFVLHEFMSFFSLNYIFNLKLNVFVYVCCSFIIKFNFQSHLPI